MERWRDGVMDLWHDEAREADQNGMENRETGNKYCGKHTYTSAK